MRNSKQGFTLVELMLVVVIIGLIAAVVVPRLAGRTERARTATARQSVASLSASLDTFELDVGRFPSTEEGLEALVVRPPTLDPETEWSGPYLRDVPLDPWHREFVYKYPGEQSIDFDIISLGRDAEEGTEDDVTNFRRER